MLYIPYLTIGDPSLEKTVEFAIGIIDAGADILELGIPFSDPTADGPSIQAAMNRAFQKKRDLSLHDIFHVCQKIHLSRPEVPLIFLSYLNPLLNGLNFLQYPCKGTPADSKNTISLEEGIRKNLRCFLEQCSQNGIKGLVIPDLPFDQKESQILRELSSEYNVSQILMVTPNTSQERLLQNYPLAQDWIYYVSSTGVTGTRKTIPPDLKKKTKSLKKLSKLPVFAGFGFHNPKQILGLEDSVDGIIVGSMNHLIIAENKEKAGPSLYDLTKSFSSACLKS